MLGYLLFTLSLSLPFIHFLASSRIRLLPPASSLDHREGSYRLATSFELPSTGLKLSHSIVFSSAYCNSVLLVISDLETAFSNALLPTHHQSVALSPAIQDRSTFPIDWPYTRVNDHVCFIDLFASSDRPPLGRGGKFAPRRLAKSIT